MLAESRGQIEWSMSPESDYTWSVVNYLGDTKVCMETQSNTKFLIKTFFEKLLYYLFYVQWDSKKKDCKCRHNLQSGTWAEILEPQLYRDAVCVSTYASIQVFASLQWTFFF